jgi:acetyl esterase/lipase
MYDMYIAAPEKRKDIYASPLQATVEQLKGLPPALIQVAESDILHDEGTSLWTQARLGWGRNDNGTVQRHDS